jgi:flagellar basal-body rod protein FlgF
MSGTIYKAASGALLQQIRLDVLSNNLANINTVGYKADKPEFRIEPSQPNTVPSAQNIILSPYTPPLNVAINFTSGQFIQTGNALDVAISGDGFFEVKTPEGLAYTRNGNFTVNPDGVLSTSDGWPVQGESGDISVSGSKVEIGEDGSLFVDGNLLDKLKLVDFPRPYDLRKAGYTRFVPAKSDVMSQPADNYQIEQGFVESSNVNAIRTMTEVIETMRVFETYQRVIRSADDATAKTVNEVGQLV